MARHLPLATRPFVATCVAGLVLLVADAAAAQEKARKQVGFEKSSSIVLELLAHIGVGDTYELAADNDDGERQEQELPAAPTVGFGLAVDYKLTDIFAVGVESQFLWVEHEEDGDRRLHAQPHLRLRAAVPVASDVVVDALFAAGMAIWEADDETDNRELDTIAEERIGFGMRFGFGVAWAMHPAFSPYASASYSLGLTPKDDVTATFQTVLISLGARTGFAL